VLEASEESPACSLLHASCAYFAHANPAHACMQSTCGIRAHQLLGRRVAADRQDGREGGAWGQQRICIDPMELVQRVAEPLVACCHCCIKESLLAAAAAVAVAARKVGAATGCGCAGGGVGSEVDGKGCADLQVQNAANGVHSPPRRIGDRVKGSACRLAANEDEGGGWSRVRVALFVL